MGFLETEDENTVTGYLRRALHHEAESVRAFERIARELAFHGAPVELIEGARCAANDERTHAARCAALLGTDAQIAGDSLPVRSLFELALDNQSEGCVIESLGALVNTHQARYASTPTLRAHFAAIAADELNHAALAHAIAAWIGPLLSPVELAALHTAEELARRELSFDAHAYASELGMPTGERVQQLLAFI
ncbi:MAG: hypothetical protein QM831_22035 [Kofleriaceae bacterium]